MVMPSIFDIFGMLALAYTGARINNWLYDKAIAIIEKRKESKKPDPDNIDSFMRFISTDKEHAPKVDRRDPVVIFREYLGNIEGLKQLHKDGMKGWVENGR